jgi:hypothetical protein
VEVVQVVDHLAPTREPTAQIPLLSESYQLVAVVAETQILQESVGVLVAEAETLVEAQRELLIRVLRVEMELTVHRITRLAEVVVLVLLE